MSVQRVHALVPQRAAAGRLVLPDAEADRLRHQLDALGEGVALALGAAQGGDVDRRAQGAPRLAVGVVLDHGARDDVHDRTVGPHDPVLVLDRPRLGRHPLPGDGHAGAILWMHHRQRLVARRRLLGWQQAQQGEHGRVPVADAGDQVALPGADATGFSSQAQAAQRVAQLRGRAARIGDFEHRAQHAVGLAGVVVVDAGLARVDRAPRAVEAADAELDLRVRAWGRHVARGARQPEAIVLQNVAVEGLLEARGGCVRRQAEHVLEVGVPDHHAVAHAGVPQAHAEHAAGQLQPALRLLRALFGQDALGDVGLQVQVEGGGTAGIAQFAHVDLGPIESAGLATQLELGWLGKRRGCIDRARRGPRPGRAGGRIVGHRGQQQAQRTATHVVQRPAGHASEAGIDPDHLVAQIGDHHQSRRGLRHRSERVQHVAAVARR